jgi:hypothetical protein
LEIPAVVDPMFYLDSLELSGSAISSNITDWIRIVIVVDGDTSIIFKDEELRKTGEQWIYDFRPIDYLINDGVHNISFYAVNWEGSASEPKVLTIEVYGEYTESISQTVLQSPPSQVPPRTLVPSQSRNSQSLSASMSQPVTAVGLIVGVTIGTVGVIVLVMIAIVCFRRHWKKPHQKEMLLNELDQMFTKNTSEYGKLL